MGETGSDRAGPLCQLTDSLALRLRERKKWAPDLGRPEDASRDKNLFHPRPDLIYIAGYSDLSPITIVRRALAKCPDQAPAPTTADFPFVTDADLREVLRTDLSEAERAFADGGWKAATILGGSLIEALLLWALQQRRPAETTTAVAALPLGDSRHLQPRQINGRYTNMQRSRRR